MAAKEIFALFLFLTTTTSMLLVRNYWLKKKSKDNHMDDKFI